MFNYLINFFFFHYLIGQSSPDQSSPDRLNSLLFSKKVLCPTYSTNNADAPELPHSYIDTDDSAKSNVTFDNDNTVDRKTEATNETDVRIIPDDNNALYTQNECPEEKRTGKS